VAGKQAGPVPAAQIYTSTWFRKVRKLVELAGTPWFILSAEHGLLSPDTPVRSYDRTLNTMRAAERRAWAEMVTRQMEAQLPNADEVVLFAGIRYRVYLLPWLQANYALVSVPMAGMPIGKQLEWMTHESTIRP